MQAVEHILQELQRELASLGNTQSTRSLKFSLLQFQVALAQMRHLKQNHSEWVRQNASSNTRGEKNSGSGATIELSASSRTKVVQGSALKMGLEWGADTTEQLVPLPRTVHELRGVIGIGEPVVDALVAYWRRASTTAL